MRLKNSRRCVLLGRFGLGGLAGCFSVTVFGDGLGNHGRVPLFCDPRFALAALPTLVTQLPLMGNRIQPIHGRFGELFQAKNHTIQS